MKRVHQILLPFFLTLYTTVSQGDLINLSNSPLFLRTSVPPNVFFLLDDTGSMDWEFLAVPFWEACAYDPALTERHDTPTTCGALITNQGLFKSFDGNNYNDFGYVYSNADNLYSDGCSGTNNIAAIQQCPVAKNYDWRGLSSDLNVIYYNPSLTYTPWLGPCFTNGNRCTNATFTSARSYPVEGVNGYTRIQDLTNSAYEVWIDNRGYTGSRPLKGTALNVNTTPNGKVDLWDSHVTITFTSTDVQVNSTSYVPTALALGRVVVPQATLSDPGACYNILGPTNLVQSIFNGTLGYSSTGNAGCMTIAQAKANFANWYQYNRRRNLGLRGAVSYVVDRFPEFRFGFNVTHNVSNIFVQVPPLPAQDYSAHNTQLLSTLFNYTYNPLPSKLRVGLNRVGEYFQNTLPQSDTNPVTASCQQNYAVLLTDTYWDDNYNFPRGDVDRDGIASTLADVARYYYITDLSPLANQVSPNPWDPATWQHMVTYIIAFGLTGRLVEGPDGWPTPVLQENSNWGNPFTDKVAQADDAWHAAFNSKGMYFGAQNPNLVANALNAILANVAQRNASAASVAQNSTVLNTESKVYQATFNSNNWQGDLIAYPISLSGVLSATPSWSANCVLTGGSCVLPAGSNPGIAPNSRVIITKDWSSQRTGIAFRWPSNYTTYSQSGNLPENLSNFLANAPYPANTLVGSEISANQAYGQALLDYLRGNRGQEIQNGGTYRFRNRNSVLGDIINSGPLFVSAPNRIYADSFEGSSYSAFKQTYRNRTPMVYAGGNDGMLHGFNANTGEEKIGFIPGHRKIYQNLPSLSTVTYPHYYFVDGSPVEGDVYFNNAWHTILSGTLRNGGQGLFALDITDPSSFTENNASNIYLWEFNDRDDPDLGYMHGSPLIVKVRAGGGQTKWAVIVGNGYNNTESDGVSSTSSTGKAALFILFIDSGLNGSWSSGTGYIKIPVGTADTTTPNGLAEPAALDIDGDRIIDYVYAGDLKGNIWKFDLRDTTPSNWVNNASSLFTASFSTAGDQPITAPVAIGPHPNGLTQGVMIYFGTGKYLEISDNTTLNQTTQTFYGIWDKLNGSSVNKNQLVQQTITSEVTPAGGTGTFRIVSNNSINWGTKLGWYLNLTVQGNSSNNGERQVFKPLLRNNNVIFTTLIPSNDPCGFGGTSWLMEINAASGGTPISSPFDLNNDGKFTTADYINIGTITNPNYVPVAGQQSSAGITPTPAVFLSPDKGSETKVLSGSQGLGTVRENVQGGPSGRQSWRQLF